MKTKNVTMTATRLVTKERLMAAEKSGRTAGMFSREIEVRYEGRTYSINDFGLSHYAERFARENRVSYKDAMLASVRYWVGQILMGEECDRQRAARVA